MTRTERAYSIRNINAPTLTPEDVVANSYAYAGDHVAASADRLSDGIDYRAMLDRERHRIHWRDVPAAYWVRGEGRIFA